MIPILYSATETDFTHHGIGHLTDTIKANVTEERNGAYELTLQYPLTGKWYSSIAEGAIIKAKVDDTSAYQLFRVYKSSKPLKGIVTFSAEHISYDLNGLPLAGFSFSNTTPAAAIDHALNSTPLDDHPFSVQSDITTVHSTTIKTPCSVRGLLGGQEGSILDVWGGEYEFDNFVIKLHSHRGADNGVSIEYGKNLTDVKQESNISEVYTHFMPYAAYNRDDGNGHTEEVYVFLTERVITLSNAPSLGHKRAYIHDFSGDVPDGTVPTEAWLRSIANSYIASHDLVTPKVNITVSFINLADTVEYKNIAPLERVKLCDTVAVKFSKLGITASAKIIKTVYNVLKEKYDSLTVGDAKSNFADTVNNQSVDLTRVTSKVKSNASRAALEIQAAIANATAAITGQSGGYVVLNPAEHPQEILILDEDSGGVIEDAVHVWRFNSAGLGHSSTGYEGPYTTAITYDGKIVADFILAGKMSGERLLAGTVTADNIAAETVRVAWNGSSDYIKLENSQLNIYKGNGGAADKLISFNASGEDLYYNNNKVGNIGSGYFANPSDASDRSKRGIAFHLENASSFMSWGWKENSADSAYTTKLLYASTAIPYSNNNSYSADTLHAGCDIDLHGYYLKNAVLKDWGFNGGCISDTFSGYYATAYNSDGTAATWRSFSLTFVNGILQSATW